MIYGIGTDICDLRRIRAAQARHGGRFAAKVLTAAEYATWQARSARAPERGLRYLGTRFSAKEAFAKAIGLGLVLPMGWQRCEIGNLASGQPTVQPLGALADWCTARGLRFHLSMSDEGDYASSFCIAEFDIKTASSAC